MHDVEHAAAHIAHVGAQVEKDQDCRGQDEMPHRRHPDNRHVIFSADDRILTHCRMWECHFHDTFLALYFITWGKGAIQRMLAEVNGHYLFARDVVPNREAITENWHFCRSVPKAPVK